MYSAVVRDHFTNPRHAGEMAGASAVGRAGEPGQGPFLVISLRVEGERIVEARFLTYGCPAAIASGSYVAEWVTGKTLEEAGALTPQQVTDGLGGLPPGKEHCPQLAVAALQNALEHIENASGGAK